MPDLTNPFASGISDPGVAASVFGSGGGGNSGAGGSSNSFGSSQGGLAGGFNPIQAGLGLFESIKGYQGLKNLEGKPMPNYTLSPEVSDYYNQVKANQGGFSGAQKASFQQGVAQRENTSFKQGTELGGGSLARALSVGLGAENLGAQNQFAGQNASLAQQQLQQLGGAAEDVQSQENLATGTNIKHYNDLEAAYGGALRAGLGNLTSGLTLQGVGSKAGGTLGSLAGLALI